jgi:hypothetical protein
MKGMDPSVQRLVKNLPVNERVCSKIKTRSHQKGQGGE